MIIPLSAARQPAARAEMPQASVRANAQDLAQGVFARLIADDDLCSTGNGVWRLMRAWWIGLARVTSRRVNPCRTRRA